jgi:hypothetical protein
MLMIRPATINDAVLTESNISEAVVANWSAATRYLEGQTVTDPVGHRLYESLTSGTSSVITMAGGVPGVITWTAHGLAEGTRILFETTGALLTGLTAGTVYFVKAPTANTFNVSATAGGSAITLSGTQSGVHTAIADPNKGVDPTTDDGSHWLDIGPTNRWAMFDNVAGTTTTDPLEIDFTLDLMGRVDALAILGLENAVTVQVIMTATPEGVVYDETFDLTSPAGIFDWYSYFTEDIVRSTTLLVTDLPRFFSSPEVQVIVTGTGTADVAVGHFAIGQQFDLGRTLHDGASVGITDYSRKEVDAFGNYELVERAFAKRGSFQTLITSGQVDGIQATLADYRATPAVYSASPDYSATLIFGFFRDFQLEIAYHNESLHSIELEGLI